MQNNNSCGCCVGLSVETPIEVINRPGLNAIAYRIGTHKDFKESLLAKLSLSHKAALRDLTTRNDDDFTIALLDAWAIVSDVLTFYQERIANESYLNTATEQLSIVELARLIGYELRPGVAASSYLAFKVDETVLNVGQAQISGITSGQEESPIIIIDKGLKVQSIPGQDEEPQIYETIESSEARAEWNAMTPRLTEAQENILNSSSLYLKGTGFNLSIGNILLIRKGTASEIKKIQKIEVNTDFDTTQVVFVESVSPPSAPPPPPASPPSGGPGVNSLWGFYAYGTPLSARVSSNFFTGTWRQIEIQALSSQMKWNTASLASTINKQSQLRNSTNNGVFVFRRSVPVFGYNAPKQIEYHSYGWPKIDDNGILKKVEWDLNKTNTNETNSKIYLDGVHEEILPDSQIAVQKSDQSLSNSSIYNVKDVNTRSRTEFGISGKTTELEISETPIWYGNSATKLSAIRPITIHAQSEPLILAEIPLDEVILVGEAGITLSKYFPELKIGKIIILSGERADLSGVNDTEIKIITEIFLDDGLTRLVFDKPFINSYFRKTVKVNANVVLATHGETVEEVLGSGNAGKAFQKFTLKQKPITYISSDSTSGTATSLVLRVNDILWKEASSLFGKLPNDQVYITRQNSLEETTITFGDGITGARLPTGQQNIRAIYKKGIGAKGMLKANQLSQLLTRPLGIKEVTNPQKTEGAQDRENLKDARANANLTIFTLDRIVSLQDYEDYARAFAGIKKAKAIWVWCGKKKCIHLTIAGVNGEELAKESQVYINLLDAIQSASISGVKLIVDSYKPISFRLKANLEIDSDYLKEKVLDSAKLELSDSFSFEKRDFGQPVALSEVSSVLSKIEGVISVDIEQLYLLGQPEERNNVLRVNISSVGIEKPEPAELLTIELQSNDLIAL